MNDLDIANNVLGGLGQTLLTSFNQNTTTGLLLWQQYEGSRDALLRQIPWSFARKWVNLAQLADAPLSLDIMPNTAAPGVVTFTSAYRLPLDFLRLFRFSPRESHWRIVGQAIYTDAVPSANAGPLLGLQPLGSDGSDNQPPQASNQAINTVGIEYIYRVTDPNLFDPLFVDTLTWKIRKEIAFGISGLVELFRISEQEYKDHLADASAVNGMENWPDEFYSTELTDVRYGYSSSTLQGV